MPLPRQAGRRASEALQVGCGVRAGMHAAPAAAHHSALLLRARFLPTLLKIVVSRGQRLCVTRTDFGVAALAQQGARDALFQRTTAGKVQRHGSHARGERGWFDSLQRILPSHALTLSLAYDRVGWL